MDRREFLVAAAAVPLVGFQTVSPTKMTLVSFCRAGVPTRNGNIYTKECLEAAFAQIPDWGRGGGVYGQLGMPRDVSRPALNDVSHLATNLRLDGDLAVADIEILSTPGGKILQGMLRDKVDLAFRMAGTADIGADGAIDMTTYKLLSINVVPAEEAA